MLIRPSEPAVRDHYDKWGLTSLDKVTFRTDSKNLDKSQKDEYKMGDQTLIFHSTYGFMNFHSEVLNPHEAIMKQVIDNMMILSYSNVLTNFTLPEKMELMMHFLKTNFKMTEVEFAFDFIGRPPFTINDPDFFNHYERSVYTPDYHVTYKPNGNVDEKFKSLICIYDRGLKLGIRSGKITRLEFRIAKPNFSCVFFNYIHMNFHDYLKCLTPKLASLLRKVVPDPSVISFDLDSIEQTHPELAEILSLAGWDSED